MGFHLRIKIDYANTITVISIEKAFFFFSTKQKGDSGFVKTCDEHLLSDEYFSL